MRTLQICADIFQQVWLFWNAGKNKKGKQGLQAKTTLNYFKYCSLLYSRARSWGLLQPRNSAKKHWTCFTLSLFCFTSDFKGITPDLNLVDTRIWSISIRDRHQVTAVLTKAGHMPFLELKSARELSFLMLQRPRPKTSQCTFSSWVSQDFKTL